MVRMGVSALALTVGFGLAAMSATSAQAETRGYVFSMIHTATYGDKSNCPAGGNGGPADIKARIFMSQGFSKEEAKKLVAIGGGRVGNLKDKNGNKIEVEYETRGRFEGKPAKITNFPGTVPDPHIELVSGKLAYGFNLDGKVGANDFEDPETHEKGIDNQMWRILGCFETYDIRLVGSSRVDLQACKLEYSIVSPK